jgi:hypothetical protein
MLINQYSIQKLKILKENPTIKYYSINFGLSGLLITDCNVANRFFSNISIFEPYEYPEDREIRLKAKEERERLLRILYQYKRKG